MIHSQLGSEASGAASVGARLRALRVRAGLSQEALAARAGLSETTLKALDTASGGEPTRIRSRCWRMRSN